MKMIYEGAIEVNKDLKLNCDKQIYDNYLKEQCDMDDDNEVQEITAARNPIEKGFIHDMLSNICSEKWVEKTIRCMKHVNQPVINKPQKIRLTNTK